MRTITPVATHRRQRSEAGQSIILIAFAFVTLLIVIGLAIDLGLVYIERIKLGKACDAAALSAAQDLPFEEFATMRAMEYLTKNGYGPQNTTLDVIAFTGNTFETKLENNWNSQNVGRIVGTVSINTADYRIKVTGQEQPADKIRVSGLVNVPMNFIRFANIFGFDFDTVPVSASALAENVSNLDIMFVYDESGSMIFDTRCYGCYQQDINIANKQYTPYPAGLRRYLPYPDWLNQSYDPVTYNGHRILTQEAEYFANATSYGGQHDYHFAAYTPGNMHWTMQRVQNSDASGYSSETGDRRGAHMMLGPLDYGRFTGYATPAAAKARAPRLDYAFDLPSAGTWYVWIRAQCGLSQMQAMVVDGCVVHWGTDGNTIGSTSAGQFKSGPSSDYKTGFFTNRVWSWVRVGNFSASSPGVRYVNFWGGGLAFRLDKIVLTTNPTSTASSSTDGAPNFITNKTPHVWNDKSVREAPGGTYLSYSYSGEYGGPADSGDRAAINAKANIKINFAVYPCNPNYGLEYNADWDGNGKIDYYESCDNRADDLFDDYQPIRFAKAAAQNFVKRLNARFDQVGFVSYSTKGEILNELMCTLTPSTGLDRMPDEPGVWDPATGPDLAWTWCYDHRASGDGLSGKPADDRTHGSIIWAIEKMYPDSSTNMAEGMKFGIETLGTGTGHYGRPNAAKVMLLLTDGVANATPSGSDPCKSDNQWPDGGSGTALDCVIYYADVAYNNSIIIYTIGLGAGADAIILNEVAERTGGVYYYAPGGDQLDAIFQQIADQVLLRLLD